MELLRLALFWVVLVVLLFGLGHLVVWWLIRSERRRIGRFLSKVGNDMLNKDLFLSYKINDRPCSRYMAECMTSPVFVSRLEEQAVALFNESLGYGVATGSWSGFDWGGIVTVTYGRKRDDVVSK